MIYIEELLKDVFNNNAVMEIIEEVIINDADRYYTDMEYVSFSIRLVSAGKGIISQDALDNYSAVLMKVITIDSGQAINAYRIIHRLNSEKCWCKNVTIIFQYISNGTYKTVYDIVIGRIESFNKENDNLSELVKFLVEYIDISDRPDNVIDTLSAHFSRISNIDKLFHILKDIQYDEDKASIKLAKLIDATSVDVIGSSIVNEWGGEENYRDKIMKLLSKSEQYSGHKLVHCINEHKENFNKNALLSMLEFCEGSVTEYNIDSFVGILKYLVENYFEKDICTQILSRISYLPKSVIDKQKEEFCKILVEIFKRSSSEDNKRKCAIVIKDKGFGRKMRGSLEEDELKEYRSYLS